MVAVMDDLISEIHAFCDAHEVSKSRFGQLAMNDRAFLFQIEDGTRECLPSTQAKVRKFMSEYRITLPTEAA